MTLEIPQAAPMSPDTEAEMVPPQTPEQAYFDQLAVLETEVPEIAETREDIEAGARELGEEFGLDAELFGDQKNVLFFTALSQRLGSLEKRRDGMSTAQYDNERTFIADATMMLARKHSSLYPMVAEQLDAAAESTSDEQLEAVYDRYTNKQVTGELKKAIEEGGLLDGVKDRLGVTAEIEEPYEVHVLNAAEEGTLYGMQPTSDMSPITSFDAETMAKISEFTADYDAYKSYADGLVKKGQEFAKETGMDGGKIPVAWVMSINGRKHLNVPLPVAEKLLYPDEERSRYYTEDDRNRDLAYLEHEYAHTQQQVNAGEDVQYGIALEELRAEDAAGNKHGYQSVKGFAHDFNTVTGIDLRAEMRRSFKDGDPAGVYKAVANKVGLQRSLELALTPPAEYIDDSRKIQKDVAGYLGGFDALTRRLYEDQSADDPAEHEKTETSMDRQAQVLADMYDHGELFIQRRRGMGLSFITDKLDERISKLLAERGEEAARK